MATQSGQTALTRAAAEGRAPVVELLIAAGAAVDAVTKTGSIANVRSLSGYVRTRNGELLAFSIIANDFVLPAATINYILDTAVEALANLKR